MRLHSAIDRKPLLRRRRACGIIAREFSLLRDHQAFGPKQTSQGLQPLTSHGANDPYRSFVIVGESLPRQPGSIPWRLMAAAASGPVRDLMSALAASGSF